MWTSVEGSLLSLKRARSVNAGQETRHRSSSTGQPRTQAASAAAHNGEGPGAEGHPTQAVP